MNYGTHAIGQYSTTMGWDTTTKCGHNATVNGYCVAMGTGVTNTENEALVNSGNIHAKNVQLFGADARLSTNVTDADPAALLANIEKIKVVTREPSDVYCKHQGRDPASCAADRAVGLLAQQVGEVIPEAVGSGASLTLVDKTKIDVTEEDPRKRAPVVGEVDDMLGLDVHALLAQQIGAIQALSAQVKMLIKENRVLKDKVDALSRRI